jgi:TetR/AcrR family transcriptional repressor of mexJK operon
MANRPDPTIRRQVMASARELLADNVHAPVATIARRAGVSRATFYRHFGSRAALLEAVEHEPPAPARERILAAAAELIGRDGLNGLSIDELAAVAGVSRATVFRLFPGKAALFGEMIRAYSPFLEIEALLRRSRDRPPEEVLPAIGQVVARTVKGRTGILRTVLLEVSSGTDPAVEGMRPIIQRFIGAFVGYLVAQMEAGRIRRVPPILAVQSLAGPVAFHLLTRQAVERLIGLGVSEEEAVDELVQVMLHGLATGVDR